jgi:hypothetical protein
MKRAIRHGRRLFIPSLLPALVALPLCACHQPPSASLVEPISPPATLPCCQYTVSGDIAHPGPRVLQDGDTVSTVLARLLPAPPGKPITLVLIRQAPEGKTRRLIQVDATGKLMDEKQDWALRNGDELVFPGSTGGGAKTPPG